MQQTSLTSVTSTRRPLSAEQICDTPTAKPGNSCGMTGRSGSHTFNDLQSFKDATSLLNIEKCSTHSSIVLMLLRLYRIHLFQEDEVLLNGVFVCLDAIVFIQGSMGARGRAQQALFSDVGETCSHHLWKHLAPAGRLCFGQTGTVETFQFY